MDTVFLALRVIVALGAVFGALFYAHRWITKGRPGSSPREKQIAIVARQGLGAKAGIAIVDASGRRYLLGITEHAVTVLDTLGPAPAATTGAVSLVSSSPLDLAHTPSTGAAAFESRMRTVAITTGAVPMIVHGRADPRDPDGPITEALLIVPVTADLPTTRRALREAEAHRQAAEQGTLAGSVLSRATWRQTADALKKLR